MRHLTSTISTSAALFFVTAAGGVSGCFSPQPSDDELHVGCSASSEAGGSPGLLLIVLGFALFLLRSRPTIEPRPNRGYGVNKTKLTTLTTLIIPLVLVACSPSSGELISGELVGQTGDTKVMLLWLADDEVSPVKLGEGRITGSRFTIEGVFAPPRIATFEGAVSVGTLISAPSEFELADGAFLSGELPSMGAISSDAVVFINEAVDSIEWTRGFEKGLSCGRCVETDGLFAKFVPIDCADLTLEVGGASCEWK